MTERGLMAGLSRSGALGVALVAAALGLRDAAATTILLPKAPQP